MTGMGADGAIGMKKMRDHGAYNIGQDKDSCVVYGMPMVAFNKGGVNIQVPLDGITNAVVKKFT
jgi:two-component system chemotaxis response regulator CheB